MTRAGIRASCRTLRSVLSGNSRPFFEEHVGRSSRTWFEWVSFAEPADYLKRSPTTVRGSRLLAGPSPFTLLTPTPLPTVPVRRSVRLAFLSLSGLPTEPPSRLVVRWRASTNIAASPTDDPTTELTSMNFGRSTRWTAITAATLVTALGSMQDPLQAQQGRSATVSIRSANDPERYVRHTSFEARLEKDDGTRQFGDDATFVVVPGLADPGSSVSFQSTNFPNHYLRHQDYAIRLHERDGSALFGQDASFRRIPGLAGHGYSFESMNYPGHYLRHRNFRFYIGPYDGTEIFRQDATFDLVRGLAR